MFVCVMLIVDPSLFHTSSGPSQNTEFTIESVLGPYPPKKELQAIAVPSGDTFAANVQFTSTTSLSSVWIAPPAWLRFPLKAQFINVGELTQFAIAPPNPYSEMFPLNTQLIMLGFEFHEFQMPPGANGWELPSNMQPRTVGLLS
jgi:hypothetical protein